jgi:hypothetical protein
MAQTVAANFRGGRVAMPLIDDLDPKNALEKDMLTLRRELVNMVAEPTTKSYSSYKRSNSKLNDDLFDAYLAASHALSTRGTGEVQTVILVRHETHEALLADQYDSLLRESA